MSYQENHGGLIEIQVVNECFINNINNYKGYKLPIKILQNISTDDIKKGRFIYYTFRWLGESSYPTLACLMFNFV